MNRDRIIEIRLPKVHGCWENCGECKSQEMFVQSVLVQPGDQVMTDDTLIVIETGKISLDFPSPVAGIIIEMGVQEYDTLKENDLIVRILLRLP